MRSTAILVSKEQAESVRRQLKAAGVLREELAVSRVDNEVAFPVRSLPSPVPAGTNVAERDFSVRAGAPKGGYRALVPLPPPDRARLPRSFDVIGDVVLVRIPGKLTADSEAIGAALLDFVPGARIVGWDQGVHGDARLRRIVRIAGNGGFRTRYRENGIEFEVDLSVAYFSPRLAGEHAHFAGSVGPGETVFDLCCGIGPFAITAARTGRARRVVAVDVNPAAIELLKSNARRVRLPIPIEAVCDSVQSFLTSAGVAERVVFNLPHEGIKYLPQVLAAVAPGGALQYYEVTERTDRPVRASRLLELAPRPDAWRADQARIVHAYSPSSDLVAYRLRRLR